MSRFHVLFLCTHNSARSLMAEALLNHWAQGRMQAFSAGSHPSGAAHPLALQALAQRGIATQGLHGKAWDLFTQHDAPRISLVITVCDNAAGEICPIWPGAPLKAHWGVAEPGRLAAGKTTEEALRAFSDILEQLERRILRFLELPLEGMDPLSIKKELDVIGRMD
ncbi:MAG: arsenate reductase ArsC [Magnetococcales bacterium]|nr:arsenate reductase ArsC [Magnetococcales bacterium]